MLADNFVFMMLYLSHAQTVAGHALLFKHSIYIDTVSEKCKFNSMVICEPEICGVIVTSVGFIVYII